MNRSKENVPRVGFITKLFVVKIFNKIPRSILLKFGYSKIGSKLVNIVRKKNFERCYDIKYGFKMYLDITNPTTWDLIEEEYEPKVMDTFVKNIKEGDTVIDVGANIGEFSLSASKKVGPKGRVISIEPLNQAAIWLEKNFLVNGFSNYEILEKAAGSKTGIMTLYKTSPSSEMGILDPKVTEKKLISSGEIKVDTIDKIMSSRNIETVEMLKIDVEGFENEVLIGCKDSFKENKIKKIICEIHTSYLERRGIDEKTIYSLLKENGFSIRVLDPSSDQPHILATLSKI